MLGVEQWAEIRRLHLVEKVPIKEIVRRTRQARQLRHGATAVLPDLHPVVDVELQRVALLTL